MFARRESTLTELYDWLMQHVVASGAERHDAALRAILGHTILYLYEYQDGYRTRESIRAYAAQLVAGAEASPATFQRWLVTEAPPVLTAIADRGTRRPVSTLRLQMTASRHDDWATQAPPTHAREFLPPYCVERRIDALTTWYAPATPLALKGAASETSVGQTRRGVVSVSAAGLGTTRLSSRFLHL